MTIEEQLDTIRQSIIDIAMVKNRPADGVTLLAVSKRHTIESIRTAYAHQQREFGENYLTEALKKQQILADLPITWHYIGSIQSNKTRKIAENFAWVHTVDSLKIAQRLAAQRPESMTPLNICLQINIDQEESKSGLSPIVDDILSLVEEVSLLPHITLRGLMCIPAPKSSKQEEKETFAQMQELLCQINNQLGLTLNTLSMGMSDDMDSAIECGATILRVGTAIFGKRET